VPVDEEAPALALGSREERGGVMSLDQTNPILPGSILKVLFQLTLLMSAGAGLAQKVAQDQGGLPKYDLHTEMKTKGVVDEIKLLPMGTRKDFTELIIKSGEDKIQIYVCPKPFEDEMGISFSKGDEIAVTGSKVKQEESDVILAREMLKGADTLLFRDDKGNPVWNWRTGK
jgi:hypothetical protein